MRNFALLLILCGSLFSAGLSWSNDIEIKPDTISETIFHDAINGLSSKSFTKKKEYIQAIATSKDPQALVILQQLLDGNIYFLKKTKTIVIAKLDNKNAVIRNAISGTDLGIIAKKRIKKVGINNKLRRQLKVEIAKLSLDSPNKTVRQQAAEEILKDINEIGLQLFTDRLTIEKDDSIVEIMQTGIALYSFKNGSIDEQLSAVKTLSNSLYPEVKNTLSNGLRSITGHPISTEKKELKHALEASIEKIDFKLGWYKQIENIFFGVSLGSVLLLAAVGLAITFGVMGVINMAHGEMLMLGAYTTYIIQQIMPNAIAYSPLIAIPIAFVFTALVGVIIERSIIRHLYGRPLETLLATFGISLILQQAVRTIISPQNRAVATPEWMSGSLQINPALALTYNRLYIILFSIAVLIGLMLLLQKTRFGLQVRAVTQNRTMAKAMGIRTDWIDAYTFGLGSGIAGMAGVALSQLTNVGPNLGQAYIIDSFMVVVFGGVGNLWGTFFGAMTLGIANKYLEPMTGAVIAKVVILVFIILFIQKRPRGMFALKGRSAEN